MKLQDMPLEDLARGVFPDGARMSQWGTEVAVLPSELDVISSIRGIRSGRIGSVVLNIGRAYEENDSGPRFYALLRLYSGSDLNMQFLDRRLKLAKPFKLDLPSWLTFANFYDAVDIGNSLLLSVELSIDTRDFDRRQATMSIVRSDVASTERFHMKIHPVSPLAVSS